MSTSNRKITKDTEPNESRFRCLIAGGGTGGHLFPAIAVTNELKKKLNKVDVLFVVGRKKIEAEILNRYGFQIVSIDVEGIKGRGWKKSLAVLCVLPKAMIQSAYTIKKFKPSVVLGVGGYSSGPVCLVAKFMGIPTAIHEQNTYPGLTNRLLSKIVERIFISFEESRKNFKKNSVVTGNPVRKELFEEKREQKNNGDAFSILVLGGSQGAKAINKVIPECLSYLNENGLSPRVLHQTGVNDFENVKKEYFLKSIKAEIVPFIEDMKSAYEYADIVISRAGATTLFELAAAGKPSILVPYPYAANQHQKTNAMSLVQMGGAEMVEENDLSGEMLGRLIMKYVTDRSALKVMGGQAKKMARFDAAEAIVDNLIAMSGWGLN
jgi:UDP-N-acetylglucosamine--N-acetylmuramyl-(pentapeptide) pyrophosphoryl-undecaprenol N-acetylglucosamine transferase